MHDVVEVALRGAPHLQVRDLCMSTVNSPDVLPTFLQDGSDVHGSHGLFYWLRARGRGHIVANAGAAMVVSWRADVMRLVALRPVGEPSAVIELLEDTAAAIAGVGDVPLVVRYCSSGLARRLAERGWAPMAAPWQAGAPADDETFPEVIVTTDPVELPRGRRYQALRQAVAMHARHYTYLVSSTPLALGESDFVTAGAARAADYDGHEIGFNDAVLSSLDADRHDALTFHYLTNHQGLAGFAITANITGIAHGYYLATRDVPRLTTYLLWSIYLQQRASGAWALNLGGSEHTSLHQFKIRTFPDHVLQRTSVLQHPGQGRTH